MTVSLLPLALAVALGSAVTLRLMAGQGSPTEAPPAPPSPSEVNREIERRLDLVVNGPAPTCGALRRAQSRPSPAPPCPSPESWREKP